MSGIAGIIRFDGGPVEPGLVERMTGAMTCRGPDGIHHWTRGSVALGHCMLHTTAESLEETQPLTNENETLVLVMDGWLSNWEELRRELLERGVRLRTRADAELVLRAYEEWGGDCLAHIDGEYAFAIWDARRREVFCARDHAGLKPLYYHHDGKMLVFASELSAVLAGSRIDMVVNEGLIAEYIAHEWHAQDETPWCGILRMLPAHTLTVSVAGTSSQRYWAPSLDAPLCYKSDDEYVDHYRHIFLDSVRRSSRSHRPVGCELSGGLDSSGVIAMARHLQRSGRLLAPSLGAFTFASDSSDGELRFARSVAGYLDLALHECSPFIPSLEWIAEFARRSCDLPEFPNGVFSIGFMRAMSEEGYRVTLGGDGGDEWLTGTRSYYAEFLRRGNFVRVFEAFLADVREFGKREAVYWLVRHGFAETLPDAGYHVLERAAKRIRVALTRIDPAMPDPRDLFWLSDSLRHTLDARRARGFAAVPWQGGLHRQRLATLANPYLRHALERADRASSVCGMERRSPLWARRIIQFAFSTDERLRLRKQTKFVHREALRGLLPDEVVERSDKTDYSPAFRQQLNEAEQTLKKEFLSGVGQSWVQPEGVSFLCDIFLRGGRFCWPMWPLWGMYGSYVVTCNAGVFHDERREERN